MVDIKEEELATIGEGTIYVSQKLYIPKNVVDFLKLKEKDKVDYFIMLDPGYRDYVLIKKQE